MQPSFKPPATEEEFQTRARQIKIPAAENMIRILQSKRDQIVKPYDAEIAFYEKVIEFNSKESV